MKAIFLALFLSFAATTADETILGRNNYFDVVNGASFECIFDGARCFFREENFASFDYEGGQPTSTVEGTVWAALDVTTDTMSLGACTADDCLVTCTANCTCTATDGTPCPQATTAAPTTATPTAAPVPQVCPEVQNKEFCAELMAKVSPNRQHDCYNFCGGVFISECDYSGGCGELTCDNQTAGVDGLIFGCTDADRPPGSAPVSSQGGSSGASLCFRTFESTVGCLTLILVLSFA
ncbi:hypothetical protein FisN_3Hu625 [Fistulifera solaris]|jgi:hypothetical protein|uniref:Uncharacterized protein n=1 Tax=Fistulifera solaris TaxID=1519565 RepID=A0A1Z5K3H5_FISSO|nr:hypothetical protein FisN_3Hu625 [Fistulifera solaris]|eukprot:GAX20528.1 hypothetical protein FisN_3Hu625 [Fistulifera solaris]